MNYTIGQRKGIGIGGSEKPLYVIEINKKKNFVVLGEKKYLENTIVFLKGMNWIANKLNGNNSIRCFAKIRSTQKESSGILKISNNKPSFIFDEKISITAPGQACVLYLNDQVLGGGWITENSSNLE